MRFGMTGNFINGLVIRPEKQSFRSTRLTKKIQFMHRMYGGVMHMTPKSMVGILILIGLFLNSLLSFKKSSRGRHRW